MDEEFVPKTDITNERVQNLEDIETDDVRTIYSDALLFPLLNESYISQFAYELFSKVRYEHAGGPTTERNFGVLPDLLKMLPLKLATTHQLGCISMLYFLSTSIKCKLYVPKL